MSASGPHEHGERGAGEVRWLPAADPQALAELGCQRIVAAAEDAIARHGRFLLVLAGGETPRAVYHRLRDADCDWSRWQLYFGDERCLPATDPGRNSMMAAQAWLDHVPLAPAQVHPIPAERGAQAAAQAYAASLAGVGAFDLVLLGLGSDGHTASLFPGRDHGEGADAHAVLAVLDSPKPPPQRVSLSAARLSHARAVLFLVAGEAKRDAVTRWRAGEDLPTREIRPPGGIDVLVEAALLDAAPPRPASGA